MKTIVITGSARGFGFEMLKLFYKAGLNVVICDINEEAIEKAKQQLLENPQKGKVLTVKCDITSSSDVTNLISTVDKELGSIDIWINNAGVNQPDKVIWEVDEKTTNRLIDIDLKGSILCSQLIMPYMNKQGSGQIYFIEGFGSNDAHQMGLGLYGTSKRAIKYFAESLAFEVKNTNSNVLVGRLTPGIMITNFISTSLGDGEKIELPEKTKKVYNILGDYPETIAEFMVPKILSNTKNDVNFVWLTSAKASWRFMTSWANKRDFFK